MSASFTGSAGIGLASLCAQWFSEVGLQQEEDGRLAAMLAQDHQRTASLLRTCFGKVVDPGLISTIGQAEQAGAAFRQAGVDAVVLVHLVWSEDQPLIALLESIAGLPLLLWNRHPTGSLPSYLTTDDLFRFSGTVGALQGSAVLQERGLRVPIVSGFPEDPDLVGQLRQYDIALRLRRRLRGLTAGRIAGTCEIMTGTRVDERALAQCFGVRLQEISASQYAQACASVEDERAQAFADEIRRRYPVVGVSQESLFVACRNTLALDDLIAQHGLGLVAIQDLDEDLHRLSGVRPCLYPPEAASLGVAFGMESDVNATLGLLAAMECTGSPCMYTELFTFDPSDNLLLMGHAGLHDPRLASDEGVTIVPDYEYRHADALEGAWQEFVLRPGPVTCLSLYDTRAGYRLTAFEGESLGGPKRLQGFAHALVRPDRDVSLLLPELLSLGLTQHFAIAPGRVASVLEKWCQLSGIEFVQLEVR
ncbi:MAG: hypothetical protein HPY83_08545 [Anaerolineae bacterium]|nr:hypothetical protein [Anaerolineae bacterium]